MFKGKRFVVACSQINRKMLDPHNAKEHYQSFKRKKNIKSVKISKIIIRQSKIFENSNIVDTRSVIIEHPKTSHKLNKAIRQAQNVSQVGSNNLLYNHTKKGKNFEQKIAKLTKQAHTLKGYAKSYNVEILKPWTTS